MRRHGAASSASSLPIAATAPLVVGRRFQLGARLGRGAFGEVFDALDLASRERRARVAVKLEYRFDDAGCRRRALESASVAVDPERRERIERRARAAPPLRHEARLYAGEVLTGMYGVPALVWYGVEGEYRALALQRLGDSLERVRCASPDGRLASTPARALHYATQMLARVRELHRRGWLHRDVKPENFVLGDGVHSDRAVVHMVDFGLAKAWRDPLTGAHRQPAAARVGARPHHVGTPRYMSLAVLDGAEPSRRDDLESIGYVVAFLVGGDALPWRRRAGDTRPNRVAVIRDAKRACDLDTLLPPPFAGHRLGDFVRYCRALPYDAEPDYAALAACLRDALLPNNAAGTAGVQHGDADSPQQYEVQRTQRQKPPSEQFLRRFPDYVPLTRDGFVAACDKAAARQRAAAPPPLRQQHHRMPQTEDYDDEDDDMTSNDAGSGDALLMEDDDDRGQ